MAIDKNNAGYCRDKSAWAEPYGLQVEEVVQAHGKAGIVAGGDFTDGMLACGAETIPCGQIDACLRPSL